MAQTDAARSTLGVLGVWIYRILIVAGAAFMLYSWFSPWWGAHVNGIPGARDLDHLVMHPWGVDVVDVIKANGDASQWSMPWIFTPFMWTYLGVCMLALAASLFTERRVSIGRFSLSLAQLMILAVGLSYLIAVGLAYEIATIKASWAGANFVGVSKIKNPLTGEDMKMVGKLKDGYWYALAAGPALIVIGLLRGLFVRRPRA